MVEVEALGEMWITVKEYIPQRERQTVADHVINVVADNNITDQDLKLLGRTDSYLRRAVEEYTGEIDEATEMEEEEDE